MSASGLQSALDTLSNQIRELDEILAADPDNADISALRASIRTEIDSFENRALEIRKRQLISSLTDNGSASQCTDIEESISSESDNSATGDGSLPIRGQHNSMQNTTEHVKHYKQPEKVSKEFCSWMAHTKGIGLKLLQKHGYMFGAGLGKVQQGRVEPVPINRRKPGSGLNFEAKPIKLAIREPAVLKPEPKPDVFDFMNGRLNRPSTVKVSEQKPTALSEADCQRDLLNLGDAIAASESERDRIKAALQRSIHNKNQDMVKHYSARLQKLDGSLNRLQSMHDDVSSTRKRQRSSSMKAFKF